MTDGWGSLNCPGKAGSKEGLKDQLRTAQEDNPPLGGSSILPPWAVHSLKPPVLPVDIYCNSCFSEAGNTVPEGLKTPVFRIIMILNALSEGMGVNAATGVFFCRKKQYLSLAGEIIIFTADIDAVFIVSSIHPINC